MKISNTKMAIYSFALLLLLALPHRVSGQGFAFVYGPSEAEFNQNGNSSLAPFATTMSGRFQQVYSASLFSGMLPPEGGIIREIAFRVDANGFNYSSEIGSLQVNLSTTTRAPDGLSSVFADNVGTDDRVMLGPTAYRVSGVVGSGFSASAIGGGNFTSNPFYYNPAAGNLLLDFRIYTGAGNFPAGGVLDAFDVNGDSVSSVFAFGSSLPTSGSASSLGLATLFLVTPIPEPSSWALLLVMGVVCLCWLKKAKRHERKSDVPH